MGHADFGGEFEHMRRGRVRQVGVATRGVRGGEVGLRGGDEWAEPDSAVLFDGGGKQLDRVVIAARRERESAALAVDGSE